MLKVSVFEVVDWVSEEPPGPVDDVDGAGGGVGAAGVGDGGERECVHSLQVRAKGSLQ